ncbi:hypothetical protein QYF61_000535 [Mycteria americana]|uniref:Uncharacterized protein n=1 Tax=Mycteria americana TaxID=33587 RepID=A0AAN7P9L3_MYCAM|nr:hypothetical protein QYF61_000535 [Mycteria americana]
MEKQALGAAHGCRRVTRAGAGTTTAHCLPALWGEVIPTALAVTVHRGFIFLDTGRSLTLCSCVLLTTSRFPVLHRAACPCHVSVRQRAVKPRISSHSCSEALGRRLMGFHPFRGGAAPVAGWLRALQSLEQHHPPHIDTLTRDNFSTPVNFQIKWDAEIRTIFDEGGASLKFMKEIPLEVENHRITESHRLEKTFKIIESNRKPNTTKTTTTPCPKHLIQMSFKYLQGW